MVTWADHQRPLEAQLLWVQEAHTEALWGAHVTSQLGLAIAPPIASLQTAAYAADPVSGAASAAMAAQLVIWP